MRRIYSKEQIINIIDEYLYNKGISISDGELTASVVAVNELRINEDGSVTLPSDIGNVVVGDTGKVLATDTTIAEGKEVITLGDVE